MESHLLQMRGLKPVIRSPSLNSPAVASFTDAWIETEKGRQTTAPTRSHLLQMRGLKQS